MFPVSNFMRPEPFPPYFCHSADALSCVLLIFFSCFGSSNTATDFAIIFVLFSFADFRQQTRSIFSVKLFFFTFV